MHHKYCNHQNVATCMHLKESDHRSLVFLFTTKTRVKRIILKIFLMDGWYNDLFNEKRSNRN